MAVNESLNYLRLGRSSFSELDEDDSDAKDESPDIVSNMSARDLLDAISKMPDGYRTIFNMYVIEGYQHNEIAEKLNITESTSRSQLKKAREYLIEIIKNDFER
jgi:RNA polymerase sigma-70 factor (ECF subfamily)